MEKFVETKIRQLEEKIVELEDRLEKAMEVARSHLVRVKNHEEISDEFVMSGKTYQDLSPDEARKLYQNPDFNFILIDVSEKSFKATTQLPEAISMPWSEFAEHSLRIHSKTTPILVISEDGTSSILACKFLVARGFYNCNNISGGYKFWKGANLKQVG